MEVLKKSYYYLFYVLNTLFKHSADSYNEHKAAIAIMFIDILVVTQLVDLYSNNAILQDYKLVKIVGIVICFPLAFFNYYIFIIKKYWKTYEEEFDTMNRNKKRMANLGVILFFLFFIWFCFML